MITPSSSQPVIVAGKLTGPFVTVEFWRGLQKSFAVRTVHFVACCILKAFCFPGLFTKSYVLETALSQCSSEGGRRNLRSPLDNQ